MSAIKSDGSGERYLGSFVYSVPSSGSETLESAAWDEGRINYVKTGNSYTKSDLWFVNDHLGNVRTVIDISTGLSAPQVLERNDYLPFGTRMDAGTAVMAGNRFRLGGKESQTFGSLDLGKVDFGARMYDSFTARWTTADPLAAKYGSMSPYNYCGGNPIVIVDLNGMAMNPVYDSYGIYRGNTIEGFTGEVIIYDGARDFTKMSASDLLYDNYDFDAQRGEANSFDNVKHKLSGTAKSRIWTHIVSQMEGRQVYDVKFSLSTLSDGVISFSTTSRGAWNSNIKAKTINGTGKYAYETTVENIQSSVIIHEWYSHIMKGNTDQLRSHRLAYKNVINYKALWNNTTDAYKKFNVSELLRYTLKETGRNQVDPPYRNLYKKYSK